MFKRTEFTLAVAAIAGKKSKIKKQEEVVEMKKFGMLLFVCVMWVGLAGCSSGGSGSPTQPTNVANAAIVGKWAGTTNLGDAGWLVFSADNTFYSSDRGSMGTVSGSYSVDNVNTVIGVGTSTVGTNVTFSATVTGTTMIGDANETISGYSLPWSFNLKKQ